MRDLPSSARLSILIAVLLPAACASEPAMSASTAGTSPEAVPINGGKLETGFRLGRLRGEATVGRYSITTSPITIAQYQACIDAGVCTRPALATASCESEATLERSPAQPVVCVQPAQATQYCSWIGGALPTDAEWLYAARGPAVRRYPWGETAPSCDQHPGGLPAAEGALRCGNEPNFAATHFSRVGEHPLGASPLGLQDVLVTPAELVRAGSTNFHPACRGAGACVFMSTSPGAIDGLGAVPDLAKHPNPAVIPVFSFRCVHEEG